MIAPGLAARPVGGFFPLDLGVIGGARRSVAARWFDGMRHRGYVNARSALVRGLLPALAPTATIRVPAFLCPAVTAALTAAGARVVPYPLAASGPASPDIGFLRASAVPGDAVIVVAAFGHPPADDLLRFAAGRRDLLWIEDRAAAAWPGEPWGDGVLYSPRKLLGVPDGGYLVLPPDGRLPLPAPEPLAPPDARSLLPSLLRHADAAEADNATWFAAHRAREAAETVRPGHSGRLTAAVLERVDFDDLATRRIANRAALLDILPPGLRDFADDVGNHAPGSVPHAVPVLVDEAATVARRLTDQRVFCPRPWGDPAAAGPCERTRMLAPRLLLLPCDHRYGPDDMARVAAALRTAMR